MILRRRQPRIALRPADDETAGWINEKLRRALTSISAALCDDFFTQNFSISRG